MWITKECKLLGTTLLPHLQLKNVGKETYLETEVVLT